VHAAEKDFCIDTVASAIVYATFSLIGFWLMGPLGVIAQAILFQKHFFRNLDRMIFRLRLT